MKNFPIVLLAGYSGAGKSTVAQKFADAYGFNFINHQRLVHDLATSKGFERARYWLASVGNKTFAEESAKEMVRLIKEKGETRGIIIDVTYGTEMIEEIKNNFRDCKIYVVGFFADFETRKERIMGRMGAEREAASVEMDFRDSFLREVGLETVITGKLDFSLTNSGKIEDTTKTLFNELEKRKAFLS